MMSENELIRTKFQARRRPSRIDIIGQNGNDGLAYSEQPEDPGKHYRYSYRVKLSQHDIEKGFIEIQLDPFRIAQIYKMKCNVLFTMLKKVLRAGNGGHKDLDQDLKDIGNAVARKQQMLEEDKNNDFHF